MIMQLQPEQISVFWSSIKYGLVQIGHIIGANIEKELVNVLTELLAGHYQCWVIYEGSGEDRKLHAFAITYILNDRLSGRNSLIIAALYGYRGFNSSLITEATEKLKAYAKTMDCNRVQAALRNPRLKELIQLMGFSSEYDMYFLEVD